MTKLRILVVAAGLAAIVAACSGGGSAASVSPPPEAELTISAKGNAFDAPTFTLAAGETTALFFRNLDAAPHNIAIYADDTASQSLFVGETITDSAITYEIPPLEPGEYFFRCDVHPDMTGTVVAEG
jgi:plastocyanin